MSEPLQFAFRTSKSIGVVNAAPTYEALSGFQKPEGHLRSSAYSPCGRYFAWAAPEQVFVVDASVGHIVTSLNTPKVFELGFSPLGTFIITWQQPTKDENGDAVKNLKVWRTVDENQAQDRSEEQGLVGKFVQKSQTNWNLQYTHDEKYCARSVTNEVQFYESGDMSKPWTKLRVEGVSDFAIAPGATNRIAVFTPEHKGQPASVKVFNVPEFGAAISQKNFFKGDKVQLKWNLKGTSLIVKAETEVDQSGKSYYGETTLYLLSATGEFDSRITLDKEGPIYDVAWSPNGKEFSVVYGFMPAKTTIFNSKADATHSFALGPRNTVKFSPNGRFLLVAGFGNLAGVIDIYDLEKNYEKVATMQASNASVCEWSPDCKYLLTAVARLKVDNGIRIYHVGGGLVFNEDMHELLQVAWRPQSLTTHPAGDPLHPVPEPHPSALEFLSKVKTPSKPAGAYRPPGARGTTTPLAFMREDQGGTAYVVNGSTSLGSGVNGFGPRKREVPGAEPVALPSPEVPEAEMSKAALKNKKKREAKKAKEAAEKQAGLTTGGSQDVRSRANSRSPERRNDGSDGQRDRSRTNSELRPRSQGRDGTNREGQGNRSRGNSQSRDFRNGDKRGQNPRVPGRSPGPTNRNGLTSAQNGTGSRDPVSPPPMRHPQVNIAAAQSMPAAPDLTVTTPGGSTPTDKKIRALAKKLRAIDDLKMRRAAGETLETTQVKKMDTEDAIRKELESLGWNDE